MSYRPKILILGLAALWAGAAVLHGRAAPAADASTERNAEQPVRLIVHNGSYSSLQVLMRDEAGRERRLGQAPPEFTNTLFITEPLPAGEVRFLARLPGESENIHTSRPTRLEPGTRLRWRLPDNVIER